ncbi:hypothetical protein IFM89_002248 [Coptis chinensis]|uniref:Large ribosomal subunit protein uL2 C-terminal domain-containing protein n=1 Tax=Coptis chinensis TaxID=261450 RepID=A0A835IMZ7_9MAGN|nr:hypothetical protein IFM89_002248 [Coptis chinensis]
MVGNVLPLRSIPEGAVVCNVEHHVGDRGVLARASGDYAIVISHNLDNGRSRIKLPSGAKKIVPSGCRAMIGRHLVEVGSRNLSSRQETLITKSEGEEELLAQGRKVGLIATRRTGRLCGQAAATAAKEKA